MTLPNNLTIGLQNLLESVPTTALSAAAVELTSKYRAPRKTQQQLFISSHIQRLAYLAVRFPATYAAIRRVLNEIKSQMPNFNPTSLCDVGAGPGTASWAAHEVFPDINLFSLLEKDPEWIDIGKNLMTKVGNSALSSAKWKQHDLSLNPITGSHDMVILSYVIGELALESIPQLIKTAWEATSQVLVVIEPGTPHGFERIRSARQELIALGGFLVAPCPHHRACPMSGGDWCHFSERLQRSEIHMAVKGVDMGYEDEKFSYVVAAKEPVSLPDARILRHPDRHSGHIDFFVCGQDGLEKRTLSRKQGPLYKKARKLDWGDSLKDEGFKNEE